MTMTDVDIRRENYDLKRENELLRSVIEREDIQHLLPWLQMKVDAQRKALNTLNHRVVTQRFILRTLDEKGRSLTREEYLEARASQPDNLKARIED